MSVLAKMVTERAQWSERQMTTGDRTHSFRRELLGSIVLVVLGLAVYQNHEGVVALFRMLLSP